MDNYIVTFHDNVPPNEIDQAVADIKDAGGNIPDNLRYYDPKNKPRLLNGFAGSIPHDHLQLLKSSQLDGSKIVGIEKDGVVTTQGNSG